jgi:hypothetical protein
MLFPAEKKRLMKALYILNAPLNGRLLQTFYGMKLTQSVLEHADSVNGNDMARYIWTVITTIAEFTEIFSYLTHIASVLQV